MSKIQQFHDLHFSQELLFIGNAWDVLSALTLEKAGFQAIGTTSWGIANRLAMRMVNRSIFNDISPLFNPLQSK